MQVISDTKCKRFRVFSFYIFSVLVSEICNKIFVNLFGAYLYLWWFHFNWDLCFKWSPLLSLLSFGHISRPGASGARQQLQVLWVERTHQWKMKTGIGGCSVSPNSFSTRNNPLKCLHIAAGSDSSAVYTCIIHVSNDHVAGDLTTQRQNSAQTLLSHQMESRHNFSCPYPKL